MEALIVHYCISIFAQPVIAAFAPFCWGTSEDTFTFKMEMPMASLVLMGNVTSLPGDTRLPKMAPAEG